MILNEGLRFESVDAIVKRAFLRPPEKLPSGVVADGFRVSEERANRIGRTHREFARSLESIPAIG